MHYNRIFVLTGAGVSAESGLTTFRDAGGLWEQHRIEDVASIEGFRRNPRLVLEFYNMRRAKALAAKPNAAHFALAELQAGMAARGGEVTLCTQNVDDLHEAAGARDVIHMHGELAKKRCADCGEISAYDGDILPELGCSACGRVGGLRPHIVWFGELPLEMDRIHEALNQADLFVAIGTSGAVYPAAGFVQMANANCIPTIEINLAPSDNADAFDLGRYGKASEQTPAWVAEVLRNGS